MQFSAAFLRDSCRIIEQLSVDALEETAHAIAAVRERGGRLFFAGSGGGAGHASHAACDFRKLGGIEAYCVSDNVSELTARINDDGWDTSYANWLRASRFNGDDALFVFSVGGGDAARGISANLVNAMALARGVGAPILGIAGRDGGTLGEWAKVWIQVPTVDESAVTPQTEGFQALLWHLLV
ncbi:MAG: SIS domain-containing protein, partial [Acidimicrobiales bacterium]